MPSADRNLELQICHLGGRQDVQEFGVILVGGWDAISNNQQKQTTTLAIKVEMFYTAYRVQRNTLQLS